MNSKLLLSPIRGLILDVSGVLKDSDFPIAGSIEAISKLQKSKLPYLFVSNESTHAPSEVVHNLNKMGFDIPANKLITPIPVMIDILRERNLKPHIMLRSNVAAEFNEFATDHPDCVVIGDCMDDFSYEKMNECFRKLMAMEKPLLFSMGLGRYYKDASGLMLDVGAYTRGLEYATGVTAEIVGKPNPSYFQTALKALGLKPDEVVMIGDDVEFDVGGAQQCGMRGVLVKTGKFQPHHATHPTVSPDAIVDDLLHAIDTILPSL